MGAKCTNASRANHMKKTVVLALILVCLMALGVVCIRPVKAQYQGDITINVDGSVSPSTAPIQHTGNIYVLTSNVNGSISVSRNNAVFDGQGYTLVGELFLNGVSNVTVENFNIAGSGGLQDEQVGISLTRTSDVVVDNNTITGMGSLLAMNAQGLYAGVYVDDGSSNVISGNNLVNNIDAIYFYNTKNNFVVGNSLTDMSNPWGINGPGVFFDNASNNTVYHNNFYNPIGEQASGSNSINIWDDGYPGGGNYWSDYQTKYPNAVEIDNSGIGNTPYVIDSQNKDRYPLMEPFTAATYLLQTTPPRISVLSPLNQTYNDSSVSLIFSVDKTVNWAGYSLDGKQNVTIRGNTTLNSNTVTNVTIANMTSGLHSLTVYANDTFGNVGASKNITFRVELPELSKPFPTVPVAAASGTSAVVVVGAGLLVYFKKHKPKTHRIIEGELT
jgi:parallel beta-helix repeat protein